VHKAVPKFPLPAPRTIVATDDEREKLFANASPRMSFFLSLCADMGLRHRTASRITLGNYDPRTHSLTFTTKGNVHQTLPVPFHIRAIIERLPEGSPKDEPIVNFLRQQHIGEHQPGKHPRLYRSWIALKKKCGIRAELHIHDLRRTLAEDVWHATKDIRVVQAQLGHSSPTTTARYLANRVGLDDLTEAMDRIQQMRHEREMQKAKPPQPERRQA
jgi:integrase